MSNTDTERHRVSVATDPASNRPATASSDDAGAGVGLHVGEGQPPQPNAEVDTEEVTTTVVSASLLITCTASCAASGVTGVRRDSVGSSGREVRADARPCVHS